jgi:hypothetical protein
MFDKLRSLCVVSTQLEQAQHPLLAALVAKAASHK